MSSLTICTMPHAPGQASFASDGGRTRTLGRPGSRSAAKRQSESAASERSDGAREAISAGGTCW